MKRSFLLLLFLIPQSSFCQPGAAGAPPVASVMYSWKDPDKKPRDGMASTVLFSGTAADMEYIEMSANTLATLRKRTQLRVPETEEHLWLIKSGTLHLTLGDSTWSLGPGSMALLMPAENFSVQNREKESCAYYVMKYRSRLPADPGRGVAAGGSIVRDWTKLAFRPHDKGGVRRYADRPTAMCRRFEMHVTTLNEGLRSHDPHTHRPEEIILVIDNRTEMQIGEKFYEGGTGDAYYVGSGIPHAIRNIGKGPCTYFAFQFD